ncbi:MAG: citrate/2-methylcitrate synthase [Desulfobacterales bacterium]
MKLIELLMEAQEAAVFRENASTHAFIIAAKASDNFAQAVAAALMTIGKFHAPITAARNILENADKSFIKDAIAAGTRIPGYGSSFVKGGQDPIFDKIDSELLKNHQQHHARIWEIFSWIKEYKKTDLYPNAACYTAVVSDISSVPFGAEIYLFIQGRLPVYVNLWGQL